MNKDIINIIIQYLQGTPYFIQWIIDKPINLNNYIKYSYDNILNCSFINEEFIYYTNLRKYRYRKYFDYNFLYLIN